MTETTKTDLPQRDGWNCHKWRRDTSWWDDLEVPTDELKANDLGVFDWLESVAPDPYEHDYVLYTDGSGCQNGWGGYAALHEKIDLVGETRVPVDNGFLCSATYGSTVNRSELNALIDGVHQILTARCEELRSRAALDQEFAYKLGTEGILSQFTGPDRISLIWYTDRNNLAQCLLFDQKGDPLMARTKERDLWMRWAFLSPYVCVTPMCRPRNVVEGQAVCDKAAGIAREFAMNARQLLEEASQKFYNCDKWTQPRPQTAHF